MTEPEASDDPTASGAEVDHCMVRDDAGQPTNGCVTDFDLCEGKIPSPGIDAETSRSVVYGPGSEYEQVRTQGQSPEALAAREDIVAGAPMTRLITRENQAWEDAQSWTLEPAESIRSIQDFNLEYGIPMLSDADGMKDLRSPVVLIGRLAEEGNFVVAPPLADYGAEDTKPGVEIVVDSGDIDVFGYRELVFTTFADIWPEELKSSESPAVTESVWPAEDKTKNTNPEL